MIVSPEKGQYKYGQIIFDKGARWFDGERIVSSIKCVSTNRYSCAEK